MRCNTRNRLATHLNHGSTAPMSMPSSRLDVATRHGIQPAFSSPSEDSLLARRRAVVRTSYLVARTIIPSFARLVETQRQPFGQPAVVERTIVERARTRRSSSG